MPEKASYLPRGQRMLNAIFGTMIRLGVIPGAHLMSVPGRKSGKMQTIPLYVLRHEGQRWLVAGYAGSDWVKNVRVAGWCEFIHDRVKERVQVIEVEETLSLQDKEIDMIKKALRKHKGKRKNAARELGISERTLYRKINEYAIEE